MQGLRLSLFTFKTKYKLSKYYNALVFIFSASLLSCGGGGGDLPGSGAQDTKAPVIKLLKPTPGSDKVDINAFIEIEFDETIKKFDTNNVLIRFYQNNTDTTPTGKITIKSTDLSFADNTLRVKPGLLADAKKYQITVKKFTDSAGNTMDGECLWEFATTPYSGSINKKGIGNCGDGPGSLTTTAKPASGIYNSAQAVTLNCIDSSGDNCANIYYTLDGTEPTKNSDVYSTAINITTLNTTTILKYFSSDSAGNNENIQTETYIIDTISPVTSVNKLAGTYASSIKINLTCTDSSSGCKNIYYTLDGSIPSTNSILYNSSININTTTILRYFSIDNATNRESESKNSQNYIINLTETTIPVLSVLPDPAVKLLQFSWFPVTGATHYRFLENPDGVSGFTQVGADINKATTKFDFKISVHQHDWIKARYMLKSCVNTVCTSSNQLSVLDLMVSRIGYFKASNTEASDSFGASIAISGDGMTLAVGAPHEDGVSTQIAYNSGAVYIFTQTANGWLQQAYIQSNNIGGGDNFGTSVSLSDNGSTLAVGAWFENSTTTKINGIPNSLGNGVGAAYVFVRSGIDWTQQAYIKASNAENSDLFGHSISLSGDGMSLAVGAYGEDSETTTINSIPNNVAPLGEAKNAAPLAGAAYVYIRTGITWTEQAYFKATTNQANDLFGFSVALNTDGSTLVVGATREDSSTTVINDTPNESTTDSGAVYVFNRSGSSWTQQAYIKANNPGIDDYFGDKVAVSGDGNTLVVGAYSEDSKTNGINKTPNDSASNSGAVYVYARSGTVWSQQAFIKSNNSDLADQFGTSVSLSNDGNTLLVGADGEDGGTLGVNSTPDNASESIGAAYLFIRTTNVWKQQAYIKPGINSQTAVIFFGSSVSLSSDGSTLAVGAESEDSLSKGVNSTPNDLGTNSGAAFLY